MVVYLLLLIGCQSSHNPDSVEIKTNSWNRSEMLDGIFSIIVRGKPTYIETFGVQISESDNTLEGFNSANQIWKNAIATTCSSGMKKVIKKTQEVREYRMPDIALTELNIVTIPGMVFAEPWIHSIVQCSSSQVTEDEINQTFYRKEIKEEKEMKNLIESIDNKLEEQLFK